MVNFGSEATGVLTYITVLFSLGINRIGFLFLMKWGKRSGKFMSAKSNGTWKKTKQVCKPSIYRLEFKRKATVTETAPNKSEKKNRKTR